MRPRRTATGAIIRTLVWGCVVALAVVVGTFAWEATRTARSTPSAVATRVPPPERMSPAESTKLPDEPPAQSPVEPTVPDEPSTEPPSPSDQHDLAARLETLEASIVKIETGDDEHTDALGSGFIVDRRGLVATNYHVVAEATNARVRFKSGAAYEVAGYAAVDPHTDLAVLQLREPPRDLVPLELVERDPGRLAAVVAVGHPQGVDYSVFEGKVSRIVLTSELPGGSQRFLRQLIEGRRDHRWVQHTAGLSEGNSGGPLLDQQGRVVGVNTWVDRGARFSYALHVTHLREMLDELFPTPAPLAKFARRDARSLELLRQLTPEGLEELYARARRFDWRPQSDEEYATLQRFAWSITAIRLPGTLSRGKLDDRLDGLAVVADRLTKQLADSTWDAVGQVTIINDHASERLFEPMAGLFFFATVERTVEGDDGARGAILRLAGENQQLFVPLDRELTLPEPGLQCLVLGVNYDGHTVRYGENPLRLVTAPVIATRTILPLRSK